MKKLLLAFLLALLTAAGAGATPFIKEVKLIGGNKQETDAWKSSLASSGWTLVDKDLNAGGGSSSDYIYLFYKAEENNDGVNWGYITDFYISSEGGEADDSHVVDGRTYYLVSYDGGDHFKEKKGDLNSNCGHDSANIHLYYTKDLFPDYRAVSDITCNGTSTGAVVWNGNGNPADLNAGVNNSYEIYMHLTTGTAMTGHQPVGALEACQGGLHKITVTGWAYDPDSPSRSINVHAFVYQSDGTTLYTSQAIAANGARADINSSQGITGYHGYSSDIPVNKAGTYKVKIYAVDYSGEGNRQIGSTTTVSVTGNLPNGHLDVCEGGNSKITVSGWTYDPDAPSESIGVHIYVYKSDGTTLYTDQTLTANRPRSDVNSHYNITGNHGFSTEITINTPGTYKVKVFAIDYSGDGTPQIGSTTTVSVIMSEVGIRIGNGETYSPLPFYSNIYSLTSQIFYPEDVGTRGSITAISFYPVSDYSIEGAKVYMKHTDKNEFLSGTDFIPVTDSDKVFEGNASSAGTGLLTFNLATPFEYNGAGNLLICIYDPLKDNDTGDDFFYAHGTGSRYLSLAYGNLSYAPALDGANINSVEDIYHEPERSDILITIKPDAFPRPDNLSVSNTSYHSATLIWSAPVTPYVINGYAYQYKKASNEAWSAEAQTTATSVTISELEPDTAYDFRIKTLYNGNSSVYAVTQFSSAAHHTPTDIAVSNITDDSATLSWNAPANESPASYVYQYKKSSDANWSSETQTTSTSVSLSGLAPYTQYDFRIKARYGSEYSDYASTQFSTAEAVTSLPYDCGFEDGIGNWKLYDIKWGYTEIKERAKRDGEFGFEFNAFINGAHDQYLISPRFSGDNAITVSFYYRRDPSGNPNTFHFGYSTSTDVSTFTWGTQLTTSLSDASWKKHEQTVPVGTRYVAIKYDSSNGNNMFLDDFHFEEYSAYAKPTGLVASNLTTQSATLSWTAPGNASPTGYAYQYKKLTDSSWSNEATVNGTSVTLNNLPANTTYDFRVKARYSGNNSSNYVTVRFITEGSAVDLPFAESFENGMGGWRIVDGSSSTGIDSDYPRTGSNVFSFHQAGAPQYLMSPQINAFSEIVFSFYYKNYADNHTIYTADFKVGYSSTTKDPDAFTWSDAVRSYYYWQQYSATFPADTKYVSVQWVDGYQLFLDDFSFKPMQVQLTAQKATFYGQEKYLTSFYDNESSYQLPEGAMAYTVIRDGTELVFVRIGDGDSREIPAGTPVVVVADKESSDVANTKEISISLMASCSVSARQGNILQASGTDTAVSGGKIDSKDVYVLGIKNGTAGFYKFTGSTVPAGKAYYLK